MPKVVKIGRGRTGKLKGQKIQERNGNPKKVRKVDITKDRKYERTPPPPRHLSFSAKAYWRDHAPAFTKTNRLNRDTRELFVQLCTIWARWLEFQGLENMRVNSGQEIIQKGKISKAAKAAAEEERHFIKFYEKFLELSSQFEESQSESRWPDD